LKFTPGKSCEYRLFAEAIGGRVVFINPLAKDYIMNMRNLLGELVKVTE